MVTHQRWLAIVKTYVDVSDMCNFMFCTDLVIDPFLLFFASVIERSRKATTTDEVITFHSRIKNNISSIYIKRIGEDSTRRHVSEMFTYYKYKDEENSNRQKKRVSRYTHFLKKKWISGFMVSVPTYKPRQHSFWSNLLLDGQGKDIRDSDTLIFFCATYRRYPHIPQKKTLFWIGML